MGCYQNIDKKKELRYVFSVLSENGMRVTAQRRGIISKILKMEGPFSVEALHCELNTAKLDIVTVYRCVSAFCELGLLTKVDFSDGISRYEYLGKNERHHHHIICTNCLKSVALDNCHLSTFDQELKKTGFTEISHKLEFYGLCTRCS